MRMTCFRASVIAGLLAISIGSHTQAASEPADALAVENAAKHEAVDDSPFWSTIELGRWRAGSHVRYHNFYADRYGEYDRLARWISLAVAVLVLGLPTIPIDPNRKMDFGRWKNIPLRQRVLDYGWMLSTVSVLAAVFMNTYPFNDWRSSHTIAYQRWNSLKSEWDQIRLEFPLIKDDAELKNRVFRLQQAEAAVEDIEPIVSDQKRLLAFEELETRVINKQREFEKQVQATASLENSQLK